MKGGTVMISDLRVRNIMMCWEGFLERNLDIMTESRTRLKSHR